MTMKAISTEKATLISTTKRHAPGARGRKDQAVLERHEADDLARRRCAASPSSAARAARRKGRTPGPRAPADRPSPLAFSITTIESATSAHAGQHGRADADRRSRWCGGCRAAPRPGAARRE